HPDLLESLTGEAHVYIDLHPGNMAAARALHDRLKIPLVLSPHVTMIAQKAYPIHRLVRAIANNSKLSRLRPDQCADRQAYMIDREELAGRFAGFPEAIRATHTILERCCYAPQLGQIIYPPSDYDHSFKALRDKAYAGALKRYGSVHDAVRTRLDYELDIIQRKGFATCFLVIEDVTSRFPLTCGRGSAAASIVSYVLEITHVDPLAHNLFFERFLNPGRVDPPDIDVDFAWDERDQVRDYLWQKYGGRHIAMVANHNTIQMTSAVREIAKVHGFSDSEITSVKMQLARERRTKRAESLSEPWAHILKLAKRLHGTPRHLSVHCGGVVITPDPIVNHCPIQPMPIGYSIVPWEKDGVEDYGLVKLDFLGNRSLAVIRDTLSSIRQNSGVQLEYSSFNPIHDHHTQQLIAEGETMGCFYVESPATRQLLQKTRMGDFESLTAISSIIRPAANKVTHDWVKRHRWMAKHDSPNWPALHPVLEEVLVETHGLMVYQEDVSRVAMALADFNATEADTLRKVLSKKHKQKQLRDLQQKFNEGCRANGLSEEQIQAIWEMIWSFSGYSFCKPHSASYALVSFKSAFLKFHYPAEFLAAVISNQGGFYSSFAYLSHARRLGLKVLQPDINDSNYAYKGTNGTIRMGLMQIKGLSQATCDRLLAERAANGPYRDLADFLLRSGASLEETKKLILVGAFDALLAPMNRPTLIWHALYWYALHRMQREELFPTPIQPEDLPDMSAYSPQTLFGLERRLLSFPVNLHPLAPYRKQIEQVPRVKACELKRYVNRTVTTIGWLITGKTVSTKHNESMCFLSFEDETDLYETTVFPDLYRQCPDLLDPTKPFVMRGLVTDTMGAISMTLTQLQHLTH
ncbi:MAG: DNA polymerase III subunit alpha, partial [Acidobacteria bacterium]|nr:DNA polymerase III subunit alpha [Acidobacteriota bacterium]